MSEILGTFFKYLFALLGVAGVVAVLSQVVGTNKDDLFVSEVAQIVVNTEVLYAGQASAPVPTFEMANLLSAQVFPAGTVVGGVPVNPWGGDVGVAPIGGGSNPIFEVRTTGVPQADCARLVTSITNGVGVMINGKGNSSPGRGGGGGPNSVPNNYPSGTDPGTLVAACQTGSANVLEFLFTR